MISLKLLILFEVTMVNIFIVYCLYIATSYVYFKNNHTYVADVASPFSKWMLNDEGMIIIGIVCNLIILRLIIILTVDYELLSEEFYLGVCMYAICHICFINLKMSNYLANVHFSIFEQIKFSEINIIKSNLNEKDLSHFKDLVIKSNLLNISRECLDPNMTTNHFDINGFDVKFYLNNVPSSCLYIMKEQSLLKKIINIVSLNIPLNYNLINSHDIIIVNSANYNGTQMLYSFIYKHTDNKSIVDISKDEANILEMIAI